MEKETALTDLYTTEKAELDNLQADYAEHAETLETTYTPRLIPDEQDITNNYNEGTTQLAQIGSQVGTKIGDRLVPEITDFGRVQRALDEGGNLVLDPETVYNLGNNSHFTISADIPAIKVVGTMSGTASPNTNTKEFRNTQMHPIIHGLQVTSEGGSLIGTGIQFQGVFGLVIVFSHLYDLRHGIEAIGINRNIIITGNHIYNLSGNGIYYNNTNIHQTNVIGNHISYCNKAIFVNGGEVHNFQIVGNDLESSTTNNPEYVIHVHAKTGVHESFVIIGNTIEDHWSAKGIIKMESDTVGNLIKSVIQGNQIANSLVNELILRNIVTITITGNTFKNSYGYSLEIIGSLINATITGNSFGSGGVLTHLTAGSWTAVTITDNSGYDLYLNPLQINLAPGDYLQNVAGMFSSKIKNNSFHMRAMSGGSPLTGYLVDIFAEIIENSDISGNSVRARGYTDKGMRVDKKAFGPFENNFIQFNSIFEIGEGKTKYEFPPADGWNSLVQHNL